VRKRVPPRTIEVRAFSRATPIGELWVAATKRGVAALGLGETQDMRRTLARLGFVLCSGESRLAREAARQVDEYLRGRRRVFTVPLDLRGAPFQLEVWRVVRAIPYGETRTYAWVARALGRPRAARAVARALAANPVPIIVPCHRVVRSDGSLGGYSLGENLKRLLLSIEGAIT